MCRMNACVCCVVLLCVWMCVCVSECVCVVYVTEPVKENTALASQLKARPMNVRGKKYLHAPAFPLNTEKLVKLCTHWKIMPRGGLIDTFHSLCAPSVHVCACVWVHGMWCMCSCVVALFFNFPRAYFHCARFFSGEEKKKKRKKGKKGKEKRKKKKMTSDCVCDFSTDRKVMGFENCSFVTPKNIKQL